MNEKRIVLFLRKKIEGQNSMEELANTLSLNIPNLKIEILPYYSTSLIGMIKNGIYASKHQGDINHIFSITEGYLSLFLKNKKIITVHDLYLNKLSLIGRLASNLFWIILPSFFTHHYTCISKYTYKNLLKKIPWIKNKTHIIYNPISKKFFNKYQIIKHSTPIILHIGTAHHKNLDNLICAIENVNCILIIVGKLSTEQFNLLYKNNIKFQNFIDISQEKLIELYNQADIISFPSSKEGFGMIVIESNALGKPVIAGDIPVLHEIGNDAAFYVNGENINELKKSIIRLLNDYELRKNLIEKGYKNANKFDIENIIPKYKNLYNF